MEENDAKEVIRIVKYSKSWNRMGAASISCGPNHEIRFPFDWGNLAITECNGTLYLATGHQGYVDDAVGQGHQGLLMIAVSESSMSWEIIREDFWHSFNHHLAIKDASHMYLLEASEGARAATVTQMALNHIQEDDGWITVLKYGGKRTSPWAIPTYAGTNGIACSSNNVLTIGTSIDQSRYSDDTYNKDHTQYRLYLTVTPQASFKTETTRLTWLTDLDGKHGCSDARLVKISDNRFLLMWTMSGDEKSIAKDNDIDPLSESVLHYRFIDGNGAFIGQKMKAAAMLPDEKSLTVKNGAVFFCSRDKKALVFGKIDSVTGAFSKKVHLMAGESALWNYKSGTLTISGSGQAVLRELQYKQVGDRVTRLVVEDGITSLTGSDFSMLSRLQEVSLGESLRELGEGVFRNCSALKSVVIPKGITSIEKAAFYECTGLESVTVRGTLTELGDYAFCQCKKLKTIIFEGGVGKVGNRAFCECGKLGRIDFPDGLTEIDNFAFLYCKGLKSIRLPAGLKRIGKLAFEECSALKSVTIPDGWREIGESAFELCSSLKSVTIGKSTGIIEEGAFSFCSSLREVRIGKGVTEIGKNAFQCCGKELAVCIPATVNAIGENAFESGYTWVGSGEPVAYATLYCESGTAAAKYGKKNGFTCIRPAVELTDKTAKRTGKPVKPAKGKAVGTTGAVTYSYYTDRKCTRKTGADHGAARDGEAPAAAGTYYVKAVAEADDVFGEVVSKKAKLVITMPVKAPSAEKLFRGELSLNLKTTEKDSKARYKITEVTKKNGRITGGSVTYLGPTSKKQKKVTIPKTVKLGGVSFRVTAVGMKAFQNCTALKEVTIGQNVTKLSEGAFSGCGKLKKITIKSSKLKSVGKNVLKGIDKTAELIVPQKQLKAYVKLFKGGTGFRSSMTIRK